VDFLAVREHTRQIDPFEIGIGHGATGRAHGIVHQAA
jgi:hypothetical protein